MIPVLLLALLLTGCASVFEKQYQDQCVVTQPNKDGKGVTAGTFPCRLRQLPPPAPPQAP